LMEQMQYNLLFRWFVGLGVDDAVWVPTVRSVRNSVYRPPARFHSDRSQPGIGEKRSSNMMAN
jgi:transposase